VRIGTGRADVQTQPPNIVLILADDLGYGDLGCYSPQSKIPTPNLDRLAREGMRFTDAHAPAAVCVPSRYGLMTGQYPFRPRGGSGSIAPGRMTIASLLKKHGYATAMIGKWHLGFNEQKDFTTPTPLRGGPLDHGFNTFFGQRASLDIPPYFFVTDDRVVTAPTEQVPASATQGWRPIQGAFWREGAIAPGFRHADVLAAYTEKSVAWLKDRRRTNAAQPFFLYVALTGPHTPWLPGEKFVGRSKAGMYGDFVAQVDDSIGRVLQALDDAKYADNTLVVVTSDNGPVWFPEDVDRFEHSSVGGLRGMKGDAWEGGHRMPFLVRWPKQVRSGTTCDETICFTDMLATFAELVGTTLPDESGEDSFSFLPQLLDRSPVGPQRESTVVVAVNRLYSVRRGDWKLIDGLGSGGFSQPSKVTPQAGEPLGQLYHLGDDPAEQTNRWHDEPAIVKQLSALLEKTRRESRSRPPSDSK